MPQLYNCKLFISVYDYLLFFKFWLVVGLFVELELAIILVSDIGIFRMMLLILAE